MWLREQGHVFDWGTLKWCQAYSSPPNGCYDAETITLDELGHVEGLDHHVNYSTIPTTRTPSSRPSPGPSRRPAGTATPSADATWRRSSVHVRHVDVDVAKYSTCLDLATVLTLSASPTGILVGGTTTLTATLKVVDARLVRPPRRQPGLGPDRDPPAPTTRRDRRGRPSARCRRGSTAGTYVLAQRLTVDTEFRAVFATPSSEGLNGDTSPTVRVYVEHVQRFDARRRIPMWPCL